MKTAIDPGQLPAWGESGLPQAPPFSLRNAWKLTGAATIALGAAVRAFISGFNFVVLGIHTIVVQKKFLPRELQMPRWRLAVIVLMIVMFACFTAIGVWSRRADLLKIAGL